MHGLKTDTPVLTGSDLW